MKSVLRFPSLVPDKTDYRVCNDMMVRIDDLAPYGSSNNAVIRLLADGSYHTILAVNAMCGRFESEAMTFSLVSSLKKAHKDMLAILADWKTKRFHSEN
jgi:hypothetical protein